MDNVQDNFYKFCCMKDPKRSHSDLEKMGQINDHSAAASDSGKANGHQQKPSKKSLRVKVPQPIKLKNHLDNSENFDVLHSHMEEQISYYVSIRTNFYVPRKFTISTSKGML